MTKSFTAKFAAGDIIFEQGSASDYAYLINSGLVEIRNGENAIAILGEGEIIGEMAIVDNSTRGSTAVAFADCELIKVSKSQLNERIDDADPVIKFLITMLLMKLKDSMNEDGEVSDHTKPSFSLTNIVSLDSFKSNKLVIEKIKLETSLKNAVTDDELFVNYQPILDFKTGEVAGFEALMRWFTPERGIVSPDEFINLAEETSLIIPMGHWIIKKSLKDFAFIKNTLKKHKKYKKPLFMSINIAAKQFQDPELFDIIDKAVKKHQLRPSEVKLEITERVLLKGDYVLEWIKTARAKGYSVSLDDFGTGYSSLSYLSELEVSSLKIDKSFVSKVLTDAKTANIVKSIVSLSKSIDLDVIAEGVEVVGEWDFLAELGCDYMQGYLYSKPLDLDDLLVLLINSSGVKIKAA